MSNNETVAIDPAVQSATIIAITILSISLDEAAKARVKSHVEDMEKNLLQAAGDNPLVKNQIAALKNLLKLN
ncbi:hypothetical protein [Serratia ureilytica]|uniref:hypothetical protein n=1 Tax=Serratia ureilytica TaxID=300181 RepID=UPI00159CB78A|nr:hypothetical protein [Serratia ureilytica]NVM48303.1 hypothetical protein [Serratia ureilytica]